MAPGSHLLISWLITVEIVKERRERALVALTGLAPDLDGAGIIIDFFTGTTQYYFKYHHYVGIVFICPSFCCYGLIQSTSVHNLKLNNINKCSSNITDGCQGADLF